MKIIIASFVHLTNVVESIEDHYASRAVKKDWLVGLQDRLEAASQVIDESFVGGFITIEQWRELNNRVAFIMAALMDDNLWLMR